MIDIITVVFRDELPILKAQAQSIDLYCQNIGVETIFVIVNDDDSVVDQIDSAWWGSLASYVKIIPRSYFKCNFVENGWVSQQVLKLLTSAISYNTWSMVLDAKTILVQPVALDRVFDTTGRLTMGYIPIFSVFKPSQEIVSQLFDINLTHVAGPGGVPFFFHNAITRAMIDKVTQLTGQQFSDWFQEQGMVTEFILYSGYVQYRDGTLDHVYVNNSSPYTVCNICHSETGIFDSKFIPESFGSSLLTVSIHRRAWSNLTPIQQKKYQTFLLTRGITQIKGLL
jgi:hypothetical protein